MAVVDASVWIALFYEDDAHHKTTREWLARHVASGNILVVPSLAQVEVAGGIARLTGDSRLAEAAVAHMDQMPNRSIVQISPPVIRAAISIASSQQVRGADAIYIAVARLLKAPLVTWDRQQLERGSHFVETFSPS